MPYNKDLELEKDKLRSIIDTLEEAILIVDSTQKIVNFNKAAENLTGYSITEVIDQNIHDIIKLFDGDYYISPDEYAPTGEIDYGGVIFKKELVKLINKQGKDVLVSIESRKIKEGSKISVGSIITIKDVSSQKELERMKLDFVSMSIHVLRTPITILRGYLSILFRDKTIVKLDEEELETLNRAVSGADELRDLVENLLNLSELERGEFKIKRQKSSIEGAIQKIINELSQISSVKGLPLLYTPPLYPIPSVDCDITRVEEVLRTLIENAIKYTDKGMVKVSVEKTDKEVKISVVDTGKGIPQENMPHLFSKFYRIKAALEMQSGSGLGLYVSKKIIEAHNGKIWVESKEGKGTTFYFTLPLFNKETLTNADFG